MQLLLHFNITKRSKIIWRNRTWRSFLDTITKAQSKYAQALSPTHALIPSLKKCPSWTGIKTPAVFSGQTSLSKWVLMMMLVRVSCIVTHGKNLSACREKRRNKSGHSWSTDCQLEPSSLPVRLSRTATAGICSALSGTTSPLTTLSGYIYVFLSTVTQVRPEAHKPLGKWLPVTSSCHQTKPLSSRKSEMFCSERNSCLFGPCKAKKQLPPKCFLDPTPTPTLVFQQYFS